MSSTLHAAAHPHHVDLRHAPEIDHYRQQLQAFLNEKVDTGSKHVQDALAVLEEEVARRLKVIDEPPYGKHELQAANNDDSHLPSCYKPNSLEKFAGKPLLVHVQKSIEEALSPHNGHHRTARCEHIVYILWLFQTFHAFFRVANRPAFCFKEGNNFVIKKEIGPEDDSVLVMQVHGHEDYEASRDAQHIADYLGHFVLHIFNTDKLSAHNLHESQSDRPDDIFETRQLLERMSQEERNKISSREPSLAHFDSSLVGAIGLKHWRLLLNTTPMQASAGEVLKRHLDAMERALSTKATFLHKEPWPPITLPGGRALSQLQLGDLPDNPAMSQAAIVHDLRSVEQLARHREILLANSVRTAAHEARSRLRALGRDVRARLDIIEKLTGDPSPLEQYDPEGLSHHTEHVEPSEYCGRTGRSLLFQIDFLIQAILEDPDFFSMSDRTAHYDKIGHIGHLVWLLQAVQAVHQLIQSPAVYQYQGKGKKYVLKEGGSPQARPGSADVVVHGHLIPNTDAHLLTFTSELDRFLRIVFGVSTDGHNLSRAVSAGHFSLDHIHVDEFVDCVQKMQNAWVGVRHNHEAAINVHYARPCFSAAIGLRHWDVLLYTGVLERDLNQTRQIGKHFSHLSERLDSIRLPDNKPLRNLLEGDLPKIPSPARRTVL